MKRTMWRCANDHLVEIYGGPDDIDVLVIAHARLGVTPRCPACGTELVRDPESAGQTPQIAVSVTALWLKKEERNDGDSERTIGSEDSAEHGARASEG
jgi:hypothetical protein